MSSPTLDSVLRATDARAADLSRLARFVALPADEALVDWLALAPGDRLPARDAVIARLAFDISAIDELLGHQLDVILHHPAFQRLEAAWRGLRRLADGLEGDEEEGVKVRMLSISWNELARDLERSIEYSQSQVFRKVYSAEFGMPGGEPFGVLIGDYEIRHIRSREHRVDDVGALRALAEVAAASFAPFIASAHPSLFGLDSFRDLGRPIDLRRIFRGPEYTAWNSLRRLEDARFIGLTLPRTLMRQPYRDDPQAARGFIYREDVTAPDASGYLWGSAAFAFGEVLIRTFIENGWMASIRGVERDVIGGGLVTSLPTAYFDTDPGAQVSCGSLEVHLTDDQEKDLGDLGFIPLSPCHSTDFAAFYGNQSLQLWLDPTREARSRTVAEINAKLSSMLQYMFCVSRFAHYVKVISRDKLGSYTRAEEIEQILNEWLVNYATSNEAASAEVHAKYPLREARVSVTETPGRPGVFQSIVHLRPHYQLDQMTSTVKLVTELFASREV